MMDEKLPDGWCWATVEQLADVIGGVTKGRNLEKRVTTTLPYLRVANVQRGFLDLDIIKTIEIPIDEVEKYLLLPGDVLLTEGGDADKLGRAAVWKGEIEKCIHQNHIFRARLMEKEIPPLWLVFYANSEQGRSYFLESAKQTVNLASINLTQLRNCPMALAPLPEQFRIVAAIEQQFTRLDSAVASLRSAKARTKQYRASLLKSAVEGELTKEWRAEHPAQETGAQLLTRILTERRKRWEEEQLAKMREKGNVPKDDKWKQRYEEPQGPDVEGLPELPEGWCWATVEQLANVIGGVTKGRNLEKRVTTTLPYLRVANVQRGFLDLDVIKTIEIPVDEVEKYLLLPGDVLLTEGGDADKLGRAAIWKGEIEKCVHQNHIFRARLMEKEIPPLWLVFYANSEQGRSYFLESAKQTVNLASINLTQLRNCPVALPPLAEQAQIVAEVEEKLSHIEQVEAAIEHSLKRAEHERQSILREAFAGRLVPQDASDEPASVLLERIREERKRREEAEKSVRVGSKGVVMRMTRKRKDAQTASLWSAGSLMPEL